MYCLTMAMAPMLPLVISGLTLGVREDKADPTHKAPLAKMTDTPSFFAAVICNVQSRGIGMINSMKSTKMLQIPKTIITLGALIAHTVVGRKRMLNLKAAGIGLQEKMIRRTLMVAQRVAMAPTAQAQ